jgi:hypothetical protein
MQARHTKSYRSILLELLDAIPTYIHIVTSYQLRAEMLKILAIMLLPGAYSIFQALSIKVKPKRCPWASFSFCEHVFNKNFSMDWPD